MRIYRYADLKERKIVNSRMTCWRWVKQGLLPPPIDLGPNSIGFDADLVDAIVASRQRAPAKAEAAP